ncbi:Uncharacterized protein PECH_004247 [Penicillium ucsense]|uniref:Uncharacterized protein n=1 Tax=Penicillium ucsense TaxID=2839758 RepID=A0A8J8W5W4_9EURO|nr:Uncharacterized protein PECM_001188 [Penicillium ucsense]KAF7737137.1 Uncharacterized protein PECH_004247 [Penicillium ucsense]
MTQDVAPLVREIERVVTAPYAPSLQDLHSLVQNSTRSSLQTWALQKPCQVGLLAELLVESLSQSRVALPLLTAFGYVGAFRDCLLKREPVILDAFLQKAIIADEVEYHAACVALLSSPLPAGFVPSARLAAFITKMVSLIAANPRAETIAPLHALMIGIRGSPSLMHEIPTDVMSNMQAEITKTLRNLDDHMGNLLGLATFAEISASQPRQTNASPRGLGNASWLASIHDFFGSRRGMKTLDLVVLRVILACSSNCNHLTPAQAAESIGLAIRIGDAVDPTVKSTWIDQNASKIGKLCEKVAKDSLSREIKIMGIIFLLSLTDLKSLPSRIGELGLRLLVSSDSRGILATLPPRFVACLVQCLGGYDDSVTYELLRFIVDTLAQDIVGMNTMIDLHITDLLLSGFKSGLSQPMITSLLNSTSIKQAIVSLLGTYQADPKQEQCQDALVCYCACSRLRDQSILHLFEIFFAATLLNGGNNDEVMIMRSFVVQISKSLKQHSCAFSQIERNIPRPSFKLRNRDDFSSNKVIIRDWRTAFMECHLQAAETSRTALLKAAEDVCFDLERRCYNVEEPVRSAERERDEYRNEAEQLRKQHNDLTIQSDEARSAIAKLKQDFTRLQEQAGATNQRAEELAEALHLARQELRNSQQLSDSALRKEQERSRSIELELIATSTEKDDRLEELHNSLRQLESAKSQLEQTIEGYVEEKAAFEDRIKNLETEAANLRDLVEEGRMQSHCRKEEVERLLQENGHQLVQLKSLQTTTENQVREIEHLRGALQAASDKAQTEMQELESGRMAEIAILNSDVSKQKQENRKLQQELQAAANRASTDMQTKDKRIRQLERKIQSLRDERAAKAREFSEAQQHMGRLMNVMGFSTNSKSETPAAKSVQTNKVSTESLHSQSQKEATSIGDNDDQELAESFECLASDLQSSSWKQSRRANSPAPNSPDAGFRAFAGDSNTDTAKKGNTWVLTETHANHLVRANAGLEPKSSPPAGATHGNAADNRLQTLDLDMDIEFSKDFLFANTTFSSSE